LAPTCGPGHLRSERKNPRPTECPPGIATPARAATAKAPTAAAFSSLHAAVFGNDYAHRGQLLRRPGAFGLHPAFVQFDDVLRRGDRDHQVADFSKHVDEAREVLRQIL